MRNPKALLDKLKKYVQKPGITNTEDTFGILVQYLAGVGCMPLCYELMTLKALEHETTQMEQILTEKES